VSKRKPAGSHLTSFKLSFIAP